MWNLRTDLLGAGRRLLRAPGTTLMTITLLALGIGGVTALFNPLYRLVLAPLPYPDSDQLVRIGGSIPMFNTKVHAFEQREQLAPIFSHVAAYAPVLFPKRARFPNAGPSRKVQIEAVSPEFFEAIGVRPQMGHDLAGHLVNSSVVVLSHRIWRTELQGAPHVIGRSILFEGHPYVVVGVMPPDFEFPESTDVWAPMGAVFYDVQNIECIGRVRPGVSLRQAATRLKDITYKRGAYQRGKEGRVLQSLHAFLNGDRQSLLWILWMSSTFLLLACAGVGNVVLTQTVRRRSEIAIRLMLGASRCRLVCQLLTETLLLTVGGGLFGIWLSTIAQRWIEEQLPELRTGQFFAPHTLLLLFCLCVAVTLFCGLSPALWATGKDPNSSLNLSSTGTNSWHSGRYYFSPYEVLVGAQLALALTLLIGTGVMLHSLTEKLRAAVGLQPQNVVLIHTVIPFLPALIDTEEKFFQQHRLNRFGEIPDKDAEELARVEAPAREAESAHTLTFNRDAQRRLAGLPGVIAAGLMSPVPLSFDADELEHMLRVCTKVSPAVSWASGVKCLPGSASSNAFDILGIRLLAGRTFSTEDVTRDVAIQRAGRDGSNDQPGVAIINEALARIYWPGESPVGKEFYFGLGPRRVVGLVSEFHQSPSELNVVPAAYFPNSDLGEENTFLVKVRPGMALSRFEEDAYSALLELAPDLPRPTFNSLQELYESSFHNLHFALILLSCFSALAATVAGLAVYAAAALMTASRTREMGLRIALGATPQQVGRLALWRSLRLALMAVPWGIFAGWGLARTLSHFLFRVAPLDPVTYIASAALVAVLTLTAGLYPARHAAATNPAEVLRYQ